MVPGRDDHHALLHRWIGATCDPGELDHNGLELAETPRRLGQPVQSVGRPCHGGRIERPDGVEHAVERLLVGGSFGRSGLAGHSVGPLSLIGRPATSRWTSSAIAAMR